MCWMNELETKRKEQGLWKNKYPGTNPGPFIHQLVNLSKLFISLSLSSLICKMQIKPPLL